MPSPGQMIINFFNFLMFLFIFINNRSRCSATAGPYLCLLSGRSRPEMWPSTCDRTTHDASCARPLQCQCTAKVLVHFCQRQRCSLEAMPRSRLSTLVPASEFLHQFHSEHQARLALVCAVHSVADESLMGRRAGLVPCKPGQRSPLLPGS